MVAIRSQIIATCLTPLMVAVLSPRLLADDEVEIRSFDDVRQALQEQQDENGLLRDELKALRELIEQQGAGDDGPDNDEQSQAASARRRQTQVRNHSLIASGESAFHASCTDCHDAARSFEKRKSYVGWLATVRRMAAKDGASVPASNFEAIARFLASRSGHGASMPAAAGDDSATEAAEAVDSITDSFSANVSATISTLFRDADARDMVEHPGAFVDAWIGLDFRTGPMRGRATLCTSCHNQRQGFSLEVAEASATIDLVHAFTPDDNGERPETSFQADVKAGRFIVPFGAYASMSHPGIYRTLTNPLMYNMGRRVFGNVGPPRQPVLPMPYADEGVNFHADVPICEDWNCDEWSVGFDLYGVNGLQDGFGGPFFASRSYTDNNDRVALGGRLTAGNSWLRFGGSLMSGDYESTGAPERSYELSGVDATAKLGTAKTGPIARVYFEYALRHEDSLFNSIGMDTIYGTVSEIELYLLDDPNLSLLFRYDTLEYRDHFSADTGLDRITWGVNMTLPGGSLLIVNHEHWMFPDPQESVDVVGCRWVAAF